MWFSGGDFRNEGFVGLSGTVQPLPICEYDEKSKKIFKIFSYVLRKYATRKSRAKKWFFSETSQEAAQHI